MSLSLHEQRAARMEALLCLFIVVLMWGLQPLALNFIMDHFSPSFTGTLRALVAAAAFAAMLWLARRRSPAGSADESFATLRERAWVVFGGVSLGLSNVCWNTSFRYTTVAAASVLQLSSTITLALIGILFLKEGHSLSRIIGLSVALLGMFLISWNGQDLSALVRSQYFWGNACAVAAGIGWAASALGQRMLLRGRSSVAIITPMMALSAVTCAAGMVLIPGRHVVLPVNTPAVILIVLTGVLGLGLGNHLFGYSLRALPASAAAATLTTSPILTLATSALFLHEPVTAYLLIGAPLTCAGVAAAVLANR